jgi:hypothetical protein
MTLGPSCGLWSTRRGLVAAVIDVDGPLLLAGYLPEDITDRSVWLSNVERHHGTGLELVFTDCTARWDPLGRLALELGHRVWIAPRYLAVAIARAAWWRPRPLQIAATLARFPRVAHLRQSLRLCPADPGPQQLGLFDRPPRHAARR